VAADVAEDTREGQALADGVQGLAEASGSGELDVQVRVHAKRAAGLAVGGALAPATLEDALGELDGAAALDIARDPHRSRPSDPRGLALVTGA
jgi:hypothetical protein